MARDICKEPAVPRKIKYRCCVYAPLRCDIYLLKRKELMYNLKKPPEPGCLF